MQKIVTTHIDDRDPAIVYSKAGKWSQQASPTAFNDTLTLTQEKGATAILAFQGTGVSVYGQVAAGRTHAAEPASDYSVDGAPPTTFTGLQNDSATLQTRFFTSPPLENGPHALVITALGAGAYFWLDFFVVEAPDESASVPGGDETPPAIVAGGTLGAVVGVSLLLLAVVAVVRRWRGKGPPAEIAMPFTTSVFAQGDAYYSPSPISKPSRNANSASHASPTVLHVEMAEGAGAAGPTPPGLSAGASNTERTDQAMVHMARSWGGESARPPEYTSESGQLGL